MSKGGDVFRPLENLKFCCFKEKDEIKVKIYSGLSKIQNFLNVHFSSIMLFYVNFLHVMLFYVTNRLRGCSFCILLFNVLASFNFEVMDVRRSFPYFSKVEFLVVYFLDRLWILTRID